MAGYVLPRSGFAFINGIFADRSCGNTAFAQVFQWAEMGFIPYLASSRNYFCFDKFAPLVMVGIKRIRLFPAAVLVYASSAALVAAALDYC